MNYQKHYNLLIEKAKNRSVEGYTEKHHIVPKCIGGNDDCSNLVSLTPEEHYVAHQLLIKIFPNEKCLVYAAVLMTRHSTKNRMSNKLYGWIKRKYNKVCKERIGEKNGSFGSFWINDGILNKKIKGDIPEGWTKGRLFSEKNMNQFMKNRSTKGGGFRKGKNLSEQHKKNLSLSWENRINKQLDISKIKELSLSNLSLSKCMIELGRHPKSPCRERELIKSFRGTKGLGT